MLEASQHTLDPVGAAAEKPCHPVEAGAKITILVEHIEKMERNDSIALVGKVGPNLLQQMLTQGAQPGCGLLEPGAALRIEASVVTAPLLRLAAKIDRPVAVLSPFRLLGKPGMMLRHQDCVDKIVYIIAYLIFLALEPLAEPIGRQDRIAT